MRQARPPPVFILVSVEQNSDNHVLQEGTGVSYSYAHLVGTDQRQATGVWYAVDRELLFGVGRYSA